MAGLIPHLIAGTGLFLLWRTYYKDYVHGPQATQRNILLFFFCVFLSVIPDVFIGTYYTTHILSFDSLMPYQRFSHYVLLPIGIVGFAVFAFLIDPKRKPVWILGFSALLLHLLMDLVLEESGLFL